MMVIIFLQINDGEKKRYIFAIVWKKRGQERGSNHGPPGYDSPRKVGNPQDERKKIFNEYFKNDQTWLHPLIEVDFFLQLNIHF